MSQQPVDVLSYAHISTFSLTTRWQNQLTSSHSGTQPLSQPLPYVVLSHSGADVVLCGRMIFVIYLSFMTNNDFLAGQIVKPMSANLSYHSASSVTFGGF